MSISKVSLLFSLSLMTILAFFYYPKWTKSGSEATISWDVSGYYWYLPAIIIYEDPLNQGFAEDMRQEYKFSPLSDQAFEHASGHKVMKYSIGQSVVFLPAFLCAHVVAPLLGYPADGFSRPYQVAIGVWCFLIMVLGLVLLRRLLLNYFSEVATGMTIITVSLATNLLEYGAITTAMTHSVLFTGYVVLMMLSERFYKQPNVIIASFIGLTVGLMALIRPTEVIACLIPILWALRLNRIGIAERLTFLKIHWLKLVSAAVLTIIVGSIQLFYWKYATGNWLVYSYEDQGFSWLHPHLFYGFFSGRAGWFTYTPVMILYFVGLFWFWRKQRELALGITLVSILAIYITFSWNIWWYGGSVGQRALIQTYPLMMFPVAALYDRFMKVDLKGIVLSSFLLVCISYNFWLTHQAHLGGYFSAGGMNIRYLQAIAFRKDIDKDVVKLLDAKDMYNGKIRNQKVLIPKEETRKLDTICLGGEVQFSEALKFDINNEMKEWVRVSGEFFTLDKEWEEWKMTQLIVKSYKSELEIGVDFIRLQRLLIPNEKRAIDFDTRIIPGSDRIEVFLWNGSGEKAICVYNIQLSTHGGK